MGVRDPLLEPPGRDHFIADIAVDFAARRDYRFSEIHDETVEQAVKYESAEPLGESRRPLHVDEQEHARFNSRPMIAAGDEIEQHVLTEQPTHVVHEGE